MSAIRDKQTQIFFGLKTFKSAAPQTIKAYNAFVQEALADGHLDAKTKELIALGMALVLRCENCIIHHVSACKINKASKEEIWSVFEVAVLMGGGPTLMYAEKLKTAVDEFYAEEKKE